MAITLTQEQFKQRYGQTGLDAFKSITPINQTQTASIAERRMSGLREMGQDIKQTFGALKSTFSKTMDKIRGITDAELEGEQGKARSFGQAFGAVAGGISSGIGDVITGGIKVVLSPEKEQALKGKVGQITSDIISAAIAKHEKMKIENPEAAEQIESYIRVYKNLDDKTKRDLESILGVSELAFDLATFGTTKKISEIGVKTGVKAVEKAGVKVAEKATKTGEQVGTVAKRTFDTTKSTVERIKNVRKVLPEIKQVGEDVTKVGVKEVEKLSKPTLVQRFAENPAITGAVDDIKIMVGLPESSPAVDMTFRAIKPRLTKKINLRRVKSQMELANQTIVESGFKPSSVKEYADAVYDTKKVVWKEIEKGLEAGELAGKEVDLVEIAINILKRAEDPALLRTNPNAAKQLVKIAEDLVSQGDNVGVLEAERMKQLLNAELEGLFGELDLSKQAKEAKKLITRKIGEQLDDVLSDLPGEFKDLKIKYGSLSAIEEDILKRAIVFERANPEGLIDMITKTQAAADLITGNLKQKAQAVARLTIGKRIKKANDANELVKRAFEKLIKKQS